MSAVVISLCSESIKKIIQVPLSTGKKIALMPTISSFLEIQPTLTLVHEGTGIRMPLNSTNLVTLIDACFGLQEGTWTSAYSNQGEDCFVSTFVSREVDGFSSRIFFTCGSFVDEDPSETEFLPLIDLIEFVILPLSHGASSEVVNQILNSRPLDRGLGFSVIKNN